MMAPSPRPRQSPRHSPSFSDATTARSAWDQSSQSTLANDDSTDDVDDKAMLVRSDGRQLQGAQPDLLKPYAEFRPPPSEMDALTFLFNSVVSFSESHRDTARGWSTELRDIYNHESEDSLIGTTVRATSLALFGSGRQNDALVRQGLVMHGDALALLRDALRDPVASRSDATLLSVLLMSQFDYIVSTREGRPYQDAHGRILPALLRHRGTDQLKDPRARRLFFNVQLQLVIARLYGASHFEEPDEVLLLEDDSDHPGAKLNNILKQIYRFQRTVALIKTRPSTAEDTRQALDEAAQIDQSLVNWSTSLRPTWQFSFISPTQAKLQSHQYWKAVHKYSDLWICRIWNSYRTARIELHTSAWNLMIWSSANHGTDHYEQQVHSQHIIQRMVEDVTASIPYGLGDVPVNEDELFSGPDRPAGFINYKAHTASMGWFLLNPILRVCLKAPHVPEEEREWIKAQLIRCCKLGMVQAGTGNHDTLLREKQPVFAFSMPIVTMSDAQANEYQLLSPANPRTPVRKLESEQPESPSPLPIKKTVEREDTPEEPSTPPPPTPAAAPSSSTSKPFASNIDLKFINTTRPGQTKDEGVQKKIRRDVMLDYHRKNMRKKLAERMQQQQGERSNAATKT